MTITLPTMLRQRPRIRRTSPAVAPPAAQSTDATFDRDYWIAHSEGYRVDGGEGRIGFVDEIRGERDRTVLAVRAGKLGRRLLLVPASEVAFVVPRAERVWLRTPTTIVGSEPR